MIGAINSNFVTTASQYGKTQQAGAVSGAKKPEEKEKTTAADNSIVSIDGDTLTISAEGAAYAESAASSGNVQEQNDVTPQTICDSAVTAVSGTATDTALQAQTSVETEADTAETSEESDETDSDDLSEYTDSELELMMYSGDITRTEYEDEMISRNGPTALEEDA